MSIEELKKQAEGLSRLGELPGRDGKPKEKNKEEKEPIKKKKTGFFEKITGKKQKKPKGTTIYIPEQEKDIEASIIGKDFLKLEITSFHIKCKEQTVCLNKKQLEFISAKNLIYYIDDSGNDT